LQVKVGVMVAEVDVVNDGNRNRGSGGSNSKSGSGGGQKQLGQATIN
jgi:hypothetical protein